MSDRGFSRSEGFELSFSRLVVQSFTLSVRVCKVVSPVHLPFPPPFSTSGSNR